MFNQKGAIPLLVLVAIIGVISFFAFVSFSPFKDQTLTTLYPKEESLAASGFINSNTFLETFDQGAPKNPDGTYAPHAPVPWNPGDWYLAFHGSEDTGGDALYFGAPDPGAQHGADCTPPPATHPIQGLVIGWPRLASVFDALFLCRDHMMTSFESGGNGYTYMTPPALLDFSAGTATFSYDVSTQSHSTRDWIEFHIAPMQYHNPLFGVNGSEAPQTLTFKMANGRVNPCLYMFYEGEFGPELMPGGIKCLESYVKASFTNRVTFQVKVSKNHVSWGIPAGEVNADGTKINNGNELIFYEADVNLPFDKAVVQMGHGSYNPSKGCDDVKVGNCVNTWHWDNISLSPAQPLTIIRTNQVRYSPSLGDTATFAKPAPPNSFLKFSSFQDVQFSVDNGATWINAQRVQVTNLWDNIEHPGPYNTAIPVGTTQVKFRWASNDWDVVKDVAIWSTTPPGPTPTPCVGTGCPTPSPTPTVPPSTPTPTPSPTPIPPPPGSVTVDFNNRAVGGLSGEYPAGIVNWTSGLVVSPPWEQFTTNNLGLLNQSTTSGTFSLVQPRLVNSIQAFNGGSVASTVTLSCSGNSAKTQVVAVNELATIQTGWTNPCSGNVTLTSSNAWNTNFDNLVLGPVISSSPTPQPTPQTKQGDLNNDGVVNALDFAILLSKWGSSDPEADLNGDGSVGLVDFSVLLSKWGT